MSSLYDRPDLYDLIAPTDPAMEAHYLAVARACGPRLLELACGTGRITIPLAEAGLDTVGGDLSPIMIDAARQRAAGRRVAPAFVELDMRHFDLGGRQFDAILIAANSLLHLHSAADFAGFFESARRHLTAGGKLAFDIFVPSIRMLAREPSERHLVGIFPHERLGQVTLEETIDYAPLTQISRVRWFWSTARDRDFWSVPIELRQIFPAELPMLLRANGFRVVERCGDFDRSPFDDTSQRQVCIAEPD